MTELQTRPLEITDDELMGWLAGSPKGKRIDEHIAKNRNLTSPKPDFHAKPVCACGIVSLQRFHGMTHANNAFLYEDVLREREAYEKEISSLEKVAGKPIVKLKEWYEESLRKANKRAEAAEMEAKANANGWKIEREELEKSERKRERAEARVKELESCKHDKIEANWSGLIRCKFCKLYFDATFLKRILAGEKTK